LAGLAEPKDGVLPGQQAAVFIKSILPEKMKIKLIIVDSFRETKPVEEPSYFYEGNHMNRWQYSPVGCQKHIVTEFDEYL
jgi:small subunit ribosomal protein S1